MTTSRRCWPAAGWTSIGEAIQLPSRRWHLMLQSWSIRTEACKILAWVFVQSAMAGMAIQGESVTSYSFMDGIGLGIIRCASD